MTGEEVMRACGLASTVVFHSSLPVFLSSASKVPATWSPTMMLLALMAGVLRVTELALPV